MLESLLNKVAEAFRSATLLKRDSNTGVFLLILENIFFTVHLWWLLLEILDFLMGIVRNYSKELFHVEHLSATTSPIMISFSFSDNLPTSMVIYSSDL